MKGKVMGLDQHAHLRGHKVDWDKYYEYDKEEQLKFSCGENTQDFSNSCQKSGTNKTKVMTIKVCFHI